MKLSKVKGGSDLASTQDGNDNGIWLLPLPPSFFLFFNGSNSYCFFLLRTHDHDDDNGNKEEVGNALVTLMRCI
jgi:hypothetical protein